jgi:hypothetical protein
MPDKNNCFQQPTRSDFEQIAHKHGLDQQQANQLEVRLRHILADLEGFYALRLDRKARAAEIAEKREFLEAINAVLAIIGNDPSAFNKYLPSSVREEMALGAGDELIEASTRKPAGAWGGDKEQSVRTVGLLHGTEIFADYLARVRAPLIDFFDEEDSFVDVGGREPNYVREYVIGTLAAWFQKVMGQAPTATAKGPFMTLVIDVFYACEIKTDGIERATETFLLHWNAPKPDTAPAEPPEPKQIT